MASFLGPLVKDPDGAYALRNQRTGGLIVDRLEAAFDRAHRNRGLLGRTSLPENQGLVLAPCNAVHMFFMRFPIDVWFVTRDGILRRLVTDLRPWRIAVSPRAFATIETAAGVARASGSRPGDRLEVVASRDVV